MEPSRCCISSIALVLLKTGIIHSTTPSGERHVTVDYNQMATAQKLLLFWRKPAVRCLPVQRLTKTDWCFSASAGGMASRLTSPSRGNHPRSSNSGRAEFGHWSSAWCVLSTSHVRTTQLTASAHLQLGMIRIRTFYYACLAGFALDTLITLDVRYHGAFNAAFILRIGCRAASQFC